MDFSAKRVLGCVVGGAIGDAMGSEYEGSQGPVEPSDSARWRITDDTQLTLATCEAILEAGGACPESIARVMARWFRSRRIDGVGASTLKALRDLDAGAHWALSGCKGEMAAGNGAAMRIAPIAFLLDPEQEQDRRTIRDISRITHHNDEAYSGALAVVAAIRFVCTDGLIGDLPKFVVGVLPETGVRCRLRDLVSRSGSLSIVETGLRFGASAHVVDSVPFAILGASRIEKFGYVDVLRQLIATGGDTDTVASIAGQIMGTRLGFDGIPRGLVAKLPCRAQIYQTANDLAHLVADQ